MEEIIGFLIILASIVISIISSVKKQSGNNNEEVSAFEEDNDGGQEQPAGMERFNTVLQYADEGRERYQQQQYNSFEDEEPEEREIEEKRENKEKAKENISVTQPSGVETKADTSKNKSKKQKHFLWQLKRDFDPKKAVIYSEIINRKYF